ncbi:MAG: hypothetical protein ABSE86_31645 [Bryobacteraceae bacterium]|jgi:hypothetical protein
MALLLVIPRSQTVPICDAPLPSYLGMKRLGSGMADVVRMSLNVWLVPEGDSSWEEIIDFKEDAKDKLWHFRRFLHELASKRQTEDEIRDDIELSLNEYSKAINLHNLKAGNSFVKVHVLPTIEVI